MTPDEKAIATKIVNGLRYEKILTREKMEYITGKSDRKNRDVIAEINVSYGDFGNILIIGTSDKRGYKIAESEDDYKHFIRERKKRAENTVLPVPKAEKLLKQMEDEQRYQRKFDGELRLF